METLIRFLKQSSTWKGITWALTLLGITLSSEQQEAIAMAGIAVVALIETFTDDDLKRQDIHINLPTAVKDEKSQFDERGFNRDDQMHCDDGYVSRDVLRSGLRVDVPTDHITGTMHDERQPTGFEDK